MSEIKTIKMIKYGENLTSRGIGSKTKEEARDCLKKNNKLFLDFDKVKVVSSGFADEFFGKLFVEFGEEKFKSNIKINNFISEDVKRLVLTMISNSLSFRKSQQNKDEIK